MMRPSTENNAVLPILCEKAKPILHYPKYSIMRLIIVVLEIALVIAFLLYHNHARVTTLATEYPGVYIIAKFLVFVAIVDAIRRVVRWWYIRRFRRSKGEKSNFEYGIDNIAKVVVIIGIILYVFQLFGIDFKTLLTSLSIVAAAIAIITKEYINDFLVGLYFSFSRNFEIHDYVKIGDYKGKITELQILKMRILNDDDDSILIPNSKVYNSEIINYTRRDIRLMSVDFELNTSNIGTIEALETGLSESLADFSEFIDPGSFNLRIVEMKKDYVELKFQYKLMKFDRELQREIRKKTVRQVFNHIAGRTS